MFRSRKDINKHHVWDSVCGTLADQETETSERLHGEGGTTGDAKSVVKIVISREVSVVGVNCNELLDKEMFRKRARKTRCGLCYNCTSVKDCGKCKGCRRPVPLCLNRKCHKPVDLFELKKDQVRMPHGLREYTDFFSVSG